MASLITRLQRRYIVEGDQLAHDAETCIGELMAAIRYARDALMADSDKRDLVVRLDAALLKCAEGD